MTIEMAHNAQAPSGPATASARGKPAADGTGGFGAVLASLDDASPCEPPVGADAGGALPKEKQQTQEADPAAVPGIAPSIAPDIAPVAQAPVDPSAMLLAQGALTGAALVQVREPATSPLPSRTGSASVTGIGESSRGTAAATALAPFDTAADASSGKGGRAPALSHDAASAALLPAAAPSAIAMAAAKSIEVDAKAAAQSSPLLATAASGLPAETATLASSEWTTTWQRVDRERGQPSAHASPSASLDGATGTQPLVAPPDAAGATASGAGAGMMERMVEQVSWWMAKGHQGAELKLELPGGAPVSVSVQVQGNEAHVAFRSDHPAARQWLGDALPQLRQMLGNEGLMLSGASVGSSGTGARQEPGRDAQRVLRAGGTPGAVAAVETPAVSASRSRTMAQRSLDLYV